MVRLAKKIAIKLQQARIPTTLNQNLFFARSFIFSTHYEVETASLWQMQVLLFIESPALPRFAKGLFRIYQQEDFLL